MYNKREHMINKAAWELIKALHAIDRWRSAESVIAEIAAEFSDINPADFSIAIKLSAEALRRRGSAMLREAAELEERK